MPSPHTKKFTLLHSNDMHGDFQAEAHTTGGKLIGGLALLSGYLSQVRREEKNVIYAISGDMLQGSMIDSEYRGISTVEIMNYLAPDVVTLGNHELDYGLPHLLFLEKMANFPVVNANLYIKNHHKRLMQPYHILELDGFSILFIGIITEDVLNRIRLDSDIATFVGLEDARAEVGRICNAYKNEDIDLTVLLTHIGYEADLELAKMLDPAWGVDLIIGGHSHTILEQPAQVNGTLVAQAGMGTDQIGRFDLVVDDDTNRIVEWKWRLIPIAEGIAPPDQGLQAFIGKYQDEVDRKFNTLLCHFPRPLTHPSRDRETELGDLFADILRENARTDIAFIISGSIRRQELGPLVTLGDFKSLFPYDSPVYKLSVSGEVLRRIFRHNLAPAERQRRILQVSRGVRAVYDDAVGDLVQLELNGNPVEDGKAYTICLQEYYFENAPERLGMPKDDLTVLAEARVVTTSLQDVVEEYLRSHPHLDSQVEGRLVIQ